MTREGSLVILRKGVARAYGVPADAPTCRCVRKYKLHGDDAYVLSTLSGSKKVFGPVRAIQFEPFNPVQGE